jgi:hypothetical protein
MNNSEERFTGFMIGVAIGVCSAMLISIGAVLSEKGNIDRGRAEGIIYCTEKPKQCAIEYKYLKLREVEQ